MVELKGTNRSENLYGSSQQDKIFGNGGNDVLRGYGSNDELFGGRGNDEIFGGPGQDILDGNRDSDKLYGDGDDDILYALGKQRTDVEFFQDTLSDVVPFGILPRVVPPAPDILTGGGGNDLFYIRETSEGEGFGFFPGQQYAVITDFQPEDNAQGDLIRLPGVANNYIARGYDRDGDGNQDSTAIVYTENPNADLSFSIPLVGVSGGRTFDIAKDDALVAIIPGVSARNLGDSDFYIYGNATTP